MGRFKMLFLLLSCLMSLQLSAASPQSINLACLDSCIAVRPHSVAKVELRLSGLKQQLGFAGDDQRKRLRLLHEIYHIYYTYQFDSALVYVKNCYAQAVACHDKRAEMKAQLDKAELLANGGFYHVSEDILRNYRLQDLPADLRYDYAIAGYWTYVYWSAFTMERITSYRNLVKLKIKAKQTEDLLRTLNSDRILNHDMAQFYLQFDKAFLGLYPHFVDDFSKLLQPEYQVSLNKDGSLTTELRIFAFIRLGVTESSEIATLLSYSPHTIYNYRSALKVKAKNRENFEDDVRGLCTV